MRIGLFFGSFDPPHIGHINAVTGTLNSGHVDKVLVIPACQNPWKCNQTNYDYRLTMTKLAFEGIPNVMVSEVENDMYQSNSTEDFSKGIPTYLVIRKLKELYPDVALRIIVSPETYWEIYQWQNAKEVMDNELILVADSTQGSEVTKILKLSDNVKLASIANITMCSTEIRFRVKHGQIITPFVTNGVKQVIEQLNLYV